MMFPNQTMLPKPTRRASSVLNSIKAILSAGISTRPPFWVVSARTDLPSAAASAAIRSRSTSSAVASVSTSSSRGMDCMPILTSTFLPWVGLALVRRARPAADAAPGEPRDELLGRLLGDRAERAQPVTGADLGHAEEPDGEQVGLVVCQAGVLPDHLADQVGALLVGRVEPGAAGGFVGEVRFEDELEGSAVLRHVLEVRGEGRVDPLPVVRRRPDRAGHGLDEPADALVEQRQVEILPARKVLVEDRLAAAGPSRDLIHRRGVVAARAEYLHGRVEQLPTASEPR